MTFLRKNRIFHSKAYNFHGVRSVYLGDLVAHMHRRLVTEGYLRASRDLKRNIQDNVNHYEDWLLNQYENEHQGNIDIE